MRHKRRKKQIITVLIVFFLLAMLSYMSLIMNREHLFNTLKNTDIKNFETTVIGDILKVSFEASNTHKNGALYIRARDEMSKSKYIKECGCFEKNFSDDLIRLKNGMNRHSIDISNFASEEIYVTMEVKPFYTKKWESSDLNCTVHGTAKYILFPLTLCHDTTRRLPSFSKYVKE